MHAPFGRAQVLSQGGAIRTFLDILGSTAVLISSSVVQASVWHRSRGHASGPFLGLTVAVGAETVLCVGSS